MTGAVCSASIWARRHPGAVAGIVHMEAFVEPLVTATTPPQVVEWFAWFRTTDGARAVLDDNHFVERVRELPNVTELRIVDGRQVYLRSAGALDRVSSTGALALDRFVIDARTGGVRLDPRGRDARELTIVVGEHAVQNLWNSAHDFQLVEVRHGAVIFKHSETRRTGPATARVVVVPSYAR